MERFLNKIMNMDVRKGIKLLPAKSVNCVVTSPPYYALRDYGHSKQIGRESTPEKYVQSIVKVFDEINRVLTDNGTVWLNLGDSYASGAKERSCAQATAKSRLASTKSIEQALVQPNKITNGLKSKDLIGIPWMVAFALRKRGWYLRQDIIWHKPNPMPESVTDRCTKSHEYIFLLTKSKKYYFDADAIKTAVKDESVRRLIQDIESQKGSERVPGKTNGNMKAVIGRKGASGDNSMGINGSSFKNHKHFLTENGGLIHGSIVNKRSVWTVTTKPFHEAHFATFPEDLISDCIKAGCPEDGVVLDPFMGAGTTAVVARKLNRHFVGIELNSDYLRIAEKRLTNELGMFQ